MQKKQYDSAKLKPKLKHVTFSSYSEYKYIYKKKLEYKDTQLIEKEEKTIYRMNFVRK